MQGTSALFALACVASAAAVEGDLFGPQAGNETNVTTTVPATTVTTNASTAAPVPHRQTCRPAGDDSTQVRICNGKKYDFSKIMPTGDEGYFTQTVGENVWYFKMSGSGLPMEPGAMPHCTFGNDTKSAAAASGPVNGSSPCTSWGQVSPQETWIIDEKDGVQVITVTFTGAAGGLKSELAVTCDETADEFGVFAVSGPDTDHADTMTMTMNSKYACAPKPHTTPATTPKPAPVTKPAEKVRCAPDGEHGITKQTCRGHVYDFSKITPDNGKFFTQVDAAGSHAWYVQMAGSGLPMGAGAMPHCAFANGTKGGIAVGAGPVSANATAACVSYGRVAEPIAWVLDDTNDTDTQTITMTFRGGDNGASAEVVVQCDPTPKTDDQSASFTPNGVVGNVARFTISSHYACSPRPTPAPVVTTTTSMLVDQRIQISLFTHSDNMRPSATCLQKKNCNTQCSLANPDQGAFFFTLAMTNEVGASSCGCKKMPTLASWKHSQESSRKAHYAGDFWYQFAMNRATGEMVSLAAVCTDDTCSNCEIDHRNGKGDACDPDGAQALDWEYDRCSGMNPTQTNGSMVDRDGSWFARAPQRVDSVVAHDVCVLKQHNEYYGDSNQNAPVTIVNYPKGSRAAKATGGETCAFKNAILLASQATYAFTSGALRYRDCTLNGDNSRYDLSVTGKESPVYSGVVGCNDRTCKPGTGGKECGTFEGAGGVCPPVGGNVAVVRADGQTFGAVASHVPTCITSRVPTEAPQSSTQSSTSTGATKPKDDGVGTTVLVGGSIGATLVIVGLAYAGLLYYRKRKQKQMNVYLALPDDQN